MPWQAAHAEIAGLKSRPVSVRGARLRAKRGEIAYPGLQRGSGGTIRLEGPETRLLLYRVANA